jgi:hypothetical protein
MSELDRQGLSGPSDYPTYNRRADIEKPDSESWASEIAMQQANKLNETAHVQPEQITQTQE